MLWFSIQDHIPASSSAQKVPETNSHANRQPHSHPDTLIVCFYNPQWQQGKGQCHFLSRNRAEGGNSSDHRANCQHAMLCQLPALCQLWQHNAVKTVRATQQPATYCKFNWKNVTQGLLRRRRITLLEKHSRLYSGVTEWRFLNTNNLWQTHLTTDRFSLAFYQLTQN